MTRATPRPLTSLRPRTGGLVAAFVWIGNACGGDGGAAPDTDASSSDTGAPTTIDDPEPTTESSSGGDVVPDPGCGDNCSAPPTVMWQTTWGSLSWESAFASAVGADGRFAVAGPVDWPPIGGFLLVYEADGTLVASDTLPEAVSGLVWDSDSTFVLAAELPATGELVLRRHDADGQELWVRNDAFPGSPGAIVQTDDGSLVVGGGAPTTGFVNRYTADGTSTSSVTTPTDMYISDVAARGDGVVIIGTDINQAVWLGVYDSANALEWWKPGPQTDAKAVAVTSDGHVVAAIRTLSGGSALLRYEPNGNDIPTITLPWQESLVTDVLALADGDIVLTTSVLEQGVPHCTVSRIDPHGVMTWGVSFATVANDTECVGIDVGPDGTFMVSGSQRDFEGDGDAWIVRIADQ